MDAFGVLQRQSIQLMFLDIRMPRLTGLELLKTLQQPPPVILTTAYRDYAVESYDYDVQKLERLGKGAETSTMR